MSERGVDSPWFNYPVRGARISFRAQCLQG
jgi:hypothetical protein